MAKPSKASLKTSVPRALAEIQTEYADLRAKAGDAQYQVHVISKNLEQINARLESINYEAAARQKLDKEEAALVASVTSPKEA